MSNGEYAVRIISGVLLLLTAGAVALLRTPAWTSLSATTVFGQKSEDDSLQADRATFPRVDYNSEQPSDPQLISRSKKYGRIPVLNPDPSQNSHEFSVTHWESALPALPAEKSDFIVTGIVVSASAHLSYNRTSVFSEFNIKIERVFKAESDTSERLEYVVAEREGGIVRFPSGVETWYFVAGQRMPTVGRRYLFFLTRDFQGLGHFNNDLSILTAYEFRNGIVMPLDRPGGGTHPIARAYIGKKSTILIEDLNLLLERSVQKPKGPEH